MPTDRQIEANRLNAQKSTGPRTEAGKAAAARNALKHGLTAQQLPEADEAAVQERADALSSALRPSDAWERTLTGMLAREEVRMERCRARQEAHRAHLARRAAISWDDDRRLEAEELCARLGRRPGVVSCRLRQTKQGCLVLLDRWRGLDRIVQKNAEWTEAQQALALDLLGVPAALRDGHPALNDPHSTATREIDRLEELLEGRLDERDEAERVQAEAEAGPPDATLKLYERYEAAAQRRFQWAYNQLRRRRPPPAPLPRASRVAGPREAVPTPLFESRPGVSYIPVSATIPSLSRLSP